MHEFSEECCFDEGQLRCCLVEIRFCCCLDVVGVVVEEHCVQVVFEDLFFRHFFFEYLGVVDL